jgi:hypothetical protein
VEGHCMVAYYAKFIRFKSNIKMASLGIVDTC